jgi:xylan 1,4-beta-xylosidase
LVVALAGAFCWLGARAAESGPPTPGALVSIDVDLKQGIGAFKPLYAWFGMDEANYATSPNGRKLLVELHDLTAAPVYIRSHNLFTSGDGVPDLKWSSTNVYSEDAAGQPVYNFRILDGIFDSYKEAGVRPLVELGFMPRDLASESGEYHVPWPADRQQSGAVFSPPSDYRKWESLVRG